ncbi:hypothetical protein HDR60_03085 [bacterium]|nr:hypothetical protein [bacterium]
MEGGSKARINLEAGLDIHTSDMLVPFQSQTFQHNWQKYQGKYLPNSLRFEKNGWAAGWSVYNFDYNTSRESQNGCFVGLGQFNKYVKTLNVYESEKAYNPVYKVYVVPESVAVVGDIEVNGSDIAGSVNGKPYKLQWDSANKKLLNKSDASKFGLDYTLNSDYSITFTVKDLESYFLLDFDMLVGYKLSGDSIEGINYTGYKDGVHSWGSYKYSLSDKKLTTPEGKALTPTVKGNQITFDYTYNDTKESIEIMYNMSSFYTSFQYVNCTDQTNGKDMLIGTENPSQSLKFNKYTADVSGTTLKAGDSKGLVINYKVPLWAVASAGFNIGTSSAKKCDNVDNGEVRLVSSAKTTFKGKALNVFGEEYDISTSEADKDKEYKPIQGLKLRFNQISIGNTISVSLNTFIFGCKRSTLNDELWLGSSRQYANIREKNTDTMNKYLGYCYSFSSSFSINPNDYLDYNDDFFNIFEPSSKMYATKDISNVTSIKRKTDDIDTTVTTDENSYAINTLLTEQLNVSNIIAKFIGIVYGLYREDQAAKTYDELYDSSGRYIGGTFESRYVNENGADFWPFQYVPKFNIKDNSGVVHKGCYYAEKYSDGTIHLVGVFSNLKFEVLGRYDSAVDPKNTAVTPKTYKRERVVIRHIAAFDFKFLKKSDFEDQSDYQKEKDIFDKNWKKWYQGKPSPYDVFDPYALSNDTTYLDYNNIEVKIVEESDELYYADPGVYEFDSKYAVPFGNTVGVIPFENSSGISESNIVTKVWHHSKDATNQYNNRLAKSYKKGSISYNNQKHDLPYYFGPDNYMNLVYSEKDSDGKGAIKTARASLVSSEIVFGINYKYSDGKFVQQNAGSSDWFSSLLVKYSRGKCSPEAYKLNAGVEAVDSSAQPYCAGDINQGIKVGWPIWGNSETRLTYTKIVNASNINDKPIGNGAIDGEDKNEKVIFKLETVPTSQLSGSKDTVYFDRDIAGSKCIHMFDVVENSRRPHYKEEDSNGNVKHVGSFSITLEKLKELDYEPSLFYAKKSTILKDNKMVETVCDYYIPGIAYGDVNSDEGNMSVVAYNSVLELNWLPSFSNYPISVSTKFSNINEKSVKHIFFDSHYKLLNNIEYELGDINFSTLKRDIKLKFPNKDLVLHYSTAGGDGVGDTICDVNADILSNVTENVKVSSYGYYTTRDDSSNSTTVSKERVVLYLNLDLTYKNNTAKFVQLSKYTLVSSDGDRCVISDGIHQATYSVQSRATVDPIKNVTTDVVTMQDGQRVKIERIIAVKCNAFIKDIFTGKIDGSIASFTYNGKTFKWDLSRDVDTGVYVLSTDIKTNKTKKIGKIEQLGQYQLLKQQWNSTVEVENFWWIDSKHVLELNSGSLVLKRNTGELHDWDGERFEKVFEIGRHEVLPTSIMQHFVTNMYKSSRQAMLVTVQEDNGYALIKVYEPRNAFSKLLEQRIRVRQRNLGDDLNDVIMEDNAAVFNTYNPLNASQLLSKADWSNTVVGDWLIIGVHLSNNFDQWAMVIDLNKKSLVKVIQGYGYVGLHGDLTGGQIPDGNFDVNKGFDGKVEPLSVLDSSNYRDYLNNLDAANEVGDVNDANNITDRVVGTSEQQWYISKKVHGIVSHLSFEDGSFTKQLLPITNNYASVYKSPSWASSVFGDKFVQFIQFKEMLSFDGAAQTVWNILDVALTHPMLYALAPRFAQIIYLQQTFGQYAYVHYNSSNSKPEKEAQDDGIGSGINEKTNRQTDPLLSSDFVFDKQKFTQSADTELKFGDNMLTVLMASFSQSLNVLDRKQSVNEELNQSAISDLGRKFVDNAMANTGDLLASAIVTQSKNDSGLTSAVTGLKSLDMFYSTSDQQRVFAGPGFVEHQFVADCVAQSVTDVQVQGSVQQFFLCLRSLTTLQIGTAIRIEEYVADGIDKAAEATAAQMVCANSLGLVGVALHATATAIRAVIAAQKYALEAIDKILDVMCSNGLVVTQDGAVSRKALSVEGKHKYGEKNEVFMWPCWGIASGSVKYTDEHVECGVKNTPWKLTLSSVKKYDTSNMNKLNTDIFSWQVPKYSSNLRASESTAKEKCGGSWTYDNTKEDYDTEAGDTFRAYYMKGNVPFYQAAPYGDAEEKTLPDDMACVEGVSRILPNTAFKNENIGVSEPAFAPSLFQDYVIDKDWDLSMCCTYGMTQWIAVKDTKIISCPPSNMIVNESFCGVACPYAAVEVKRGVEKAYMRPYAITPNVIALNCTGYNSILDNKLYHAFDGMSYRLVNLVGSPGMGKNRQAFWYSFQVNDRFKRSNKLPANELQGNFESEPVQAIESIDKLWTQMTVASREKGLEAGTIGEDKDLKRLAVPVFTEHLSTLPAVVKTLTAMPLGVVEGITSMCTEIANNQTAYKAPLSIDFNIGKNVYRATEEYICSVNTKDGVDIVSDIIPISGLRYIGSTPTEAYFYSESTRAFYIFTGSSLTKMDTMERFRDVQKGYWDFVNQEVVLPSLMTFKRLNAEVEDKDTETDNIVMPVLSKSQVSGELPPPITTIFNDRSWFKVVSLPSGLAYQGPNRVIINRSIFVEHMLDSLKNNLGKWSKMNREKYVTHRVYREKYADVMSEVSGVDGWTYNPFVLVTSALGSNEDTDCMFEWVVTFCWPIEMDLIYGVDNYACVNIVAETMTPGGKKVTRPTHVYLQKELFTRDGNYGYYSFRFQGNNGMGNRERLHIWSDQYIAISSIDCEYKVMTSRRAEQLTQQIDVSKLKEL